MSDPRALVLRTSGTNCEHETAEALELAGAKTDIARTEPFFAEPARLDDYQIVVMAGGFSYGDDLGAGRVWGFQVRRNVGPALRSFVDRGGLVLGICNGFQVLVESGIFEPDASAEERSVALYGNASNHYECRWTTLEGQDCICPWVEPGEHMPTPLAHAEGRFVVRDDATYQRLVQNRQIAFRYVDPDGQAGADELPYPMNPNGSRASIAGICDPTGRVLGMMPHPERNVRPWQHPTWSRKGSRPEGEGLAFYRRMVEYAAAATSHV